ncbi:TIGR02186 family protein [Paracoccus sp. pheM1]|uniref:TIGR02186 family protein n=1 Tax=Paracoccus sp. pheM1 TaxID=2831675 RepID=UPI001BDB9005|nr:TIGR02186 family protein [Paracoccus sp. pheM1]MBT0780145.1 TIGR02186 family protein [Paracoccus sp. pheM1]
MIRHALFAALAPVLLALPANAQPATPQPPPEQIVAGLSRDDVDITTSFDGSEIIIYGAIKRETRIPAGAPLDVIVTLEGPAQALTVRHKERRLGIWINTGRVSVGAAPSFYVVATTRPLHLILPTAEDQRHRISIPLAMRAFAGPMEVEDAVPYTEALIRLRRASDLYRQDDGAVRLAEQTLFRADVRLPANLVEGVYSTRIFLLRDGRVIDTFRAPIEVRKVGLERWLYRLALEQPFIYGIMSLAIAVAAGWGASAAFRLVKRP